MDSMISKIIFEKITFFFQMDDPTQLKDEGNKHFQAGEIDKAIECYTNAIKVCKDKKLLAVIYRNRSACFLKKVSRFLQCLKTFYRVRKKGILLNLLFFTYRKVIPMQPLMQLKVHQLKKTVNSYSFKTIHNITLFSSFLICRSFIAIDVDAADIKALYRRCQALEKLGKLDMAFKDVQRCATLEPKNKTFLDTLRRLGAEIQAKVSFKLIVWNFKIKQNT